MDSGGGHEFQPPNLDAKAMAKVVLFDFMFHRLFL